MPKSKKAIESTQARQGSSRPRAPNWTDALDMIMLGLMRQENDEGNCHNGTFSQDTWRKMTNLFNERTNLSFSFRNLKNRLKVLKKTFNLYYNLANRSGWGWDPALNLPTCGDEHMWEEVISVNKDYARIKGKSFPAYDDIDILFSRHTATGRRGDTSAIPVGVSDNDTSDDEMDRINLEDIEFGHPSQKRGGVSCSSAGPFDQRFVDVSPSSPTTFASTLPTDCSGEGGMSTSSGKRKRSSSITPTARKIRCSTDAADVLQELVDQGQRRLEIVNEMLRRDQLARPTVYSIDECMRKLESIPGITPECILAVGDSLKIEINRWFLMHYEGPLLEAWLKRQMADFYRIPPSVAGPSGSYAPMPNIFMPPMHAAHQGGPPVFVPPPLHAASTGGHSPVMRPLFRPSSDDSISHGQTHSPVSSAEETLCTTSASSTQQSEFGHFHRWP